MQAWLAVDSALNFFMLHSLWTKQLDLFLVHTYTQIYQNFSLKWATIIPIDQLKKSATDSDIMQLIDLVVSETGYRKYIETDEKAGDVVEKEEDEEEVYGIFTGKNTRENM